MSSAYQDLLDQARAREKEADQDFKIVFAMITELKARIQKLEAELRLANVRAIVRSEAA
jgi:hypothetical protein